MNQWYYILEGKVQGPLSEEDMKHVFCCGALPFETQVWQEGMKAWANATNCLNFAETSANSKTQSIQAITSCRAEKTVSQKSDGGKVSDKQGETSDDQAAAISETKEHSDNALNGTEPQADECRKPGGLPITALAVSTELQCEQRQIVVGNRWLQIALSVVATITIVIWLTQKQASSDFNPSGRGSISSPRIAANESVKAHLKSTVVDDGNGSNPQVKKNEIQKLSNTPASTILRPVTVKRGKLLEHFISGTISLEELKQLAETLPRMDKATMLKELGRDYSRLPYGPYPKYIDELYFEGLQDPNTGKRYTLLIYVDSDASWAPKRAFDGYIIEGTAFGNRVVHFPESGSGR